MYNESPFLVCLYLYSLRFVILLLPHCAVLAVQVLGSSTIRIDVHRCLMTIIIAVSVT